MLRIPRCLRFKAEEVTASSVADCSLSFVSAVDICRVSRFLEVVLVPIVDL